METFIYITTVISMVANGLVIALLIKERKSKNRVIESKNQVIEDFKTLMDTTDIKRLSTFYKDLDEVKTKAMLASAELKTANWFKEMDATFKTQFDELASFAATFVQVGKTDEEKLLLIRQGFPSCLSLFEKYLDGQVRKDSGAGNNDRQG